MRVMAIHAIGRVTCQSLMGDGEEHGSKLL